MTILIEQFQRRFYLIGNTFPIKDQLRIAGCKWDGDRKAWWTGKREVAEKFVGEVTPMEQTDQEAQEARSRKRCQAKVKYKGKTYYVIGVSRDSTRMLLTPLDCSIEFWVDQTNCEMLRVYKPQQRWGGYGCGQVEVHQTVGKIREFIEQSRKDEAAIRKGEIPPGYCVDLEDGQIKRRSECDIPSS